MAILSEVELARLADVIGEVEEKTCGEIRVMIVKRSAGTSHVAILLWALLSTLAFVTLWNFRHEYELLESVWVTPGVLFCTFFASGILARFAFVQRRMTHYADLHHQVWARAEVEFHREGLSDTTSHTGVLLFVSLFEKQAVVLADKAIAEKVSTHTWDQVVHTIVEGARTGNWAVKLEQGIRECGAYLADHFPPKPGKGNELPNTVIVKD